MRTRWIPVALALTLMATPTFGEDDTLRFGVRDVPDKPDGAIRLATYNVLNLFDETDDPDLSGRWDDMDNIKPESEVEAVARAIRAVDADIIAFQEVESLEALTWFRDTYLDGMGYDHIASRDVAYYRGVENSVLSRFPITSTRVWLDMELDGEHPKLWNGRPNRYYGEPLLFRRSPLCVDIQVSDDYELRLYVVHHKAGAGNEYWREAEGKGVVKLIQADRQADPNVNIAVLGDFNAEPWEPSVRQYLQAGMIDTMAHRAVDCHDVDPLYITHESGRAIDYVMVSSGLCCEVIPGSAFIFSTPARQEGHDYRVDPKPKGYGSDHYPLAVDLIPIDR
ncbi:MAG: endonuclease/exonuclease/phosphatase family protein [Phycisphaerales bacterium]|nr:endonuclease/exonuclease/phosphatase family protein [Phycisphaerales bacterium]